jgi:hypothetical protein
MSSADAANPRPIATARARTAVAVFGATLFSSALLMFLIQPMFAKMALPRLGGTAAVWSLALVFFQGVLLLGYAYAHLIVRFLSLRTGVVLHVMVMSGAVVSLPIAITSRWDMPPESGEALWLMGLFAASVGLPFFAISANAPLLQTWFSRSGHAQSSDPYFLYGASNAGSFAALVAYPLVVEPLLGLAPQTHLWSLGYILLVVMVSSCGYLATAAAAAATGTAVPEPGAASLPAEVTWSNRLSWIALSFVPSGLLVGTTAHMATDLVSAPFMWVVPLALYLLTFVITFQAKPVVPHAFVLDRIGVIVAPLCLFALSPATQIWLVPVHLLCVFMLMMACHGELVRLRPAAGQLTQFFLLMSVGGVLGGMFASLVAPAIFDSIVEYPLLIIAGFAAVGLVRNGGRLSGRFYQSLALVPVVLLGIWLAGDTAALKHGMMLGWLLFALVLLLATARDQMAQAVILLTVMFIYQTVSRVPAPIMQSRSFYGVLSVFPAMDGRFHLLAHGTTRHGSQMMTDANGLRLTDHTEPQSYYYSNGPFGSLIRHMREDGRRLDNVAVVGLGTGAMLCHAQPGEDWSFYEIDPHVVTIAQDPNYFTFLRDCGPSRIVLGDGRLKLAQEPAQKFDLIVLDAFSSDSVPAHLITAEALKVYMDKLKPDGLVVFHVSNRFMELGATIEGAVRQGGYHAWYNALDLSFWNPDPDRLDARPYLAVVTRSPGDARGLANDPAWHQAEADEAAPAWTDDYSNVLGAIWRKYKGRSPFDR